MLGNFETFSAKHKSLWNLLWSPWTAGQRKKKCSAAPHSTQHWLPSTSTHWCDHAGSAPAVL